MIDIDREHPDFRRQKLTWRSYRDLYAGGHQFKQRAADYLLRRQKEPLDVYSERLQRVFYETISARSWIGIPRHYSGVGRLCTFKGITKQVRAFYRNWRMIAICAERIWQVFSDGASAMRLSQAAVIF